MFKKIFLLSLFFIVVISGVKAQVSPDANPLPKNLQLPFSMKLPNSSWYLAVNEAPDHYIFKRQPIKDSQGRNIIPAIMVYVESKNELKEDLGSVYKDHPVADLRTYFEAFWDQKMMPVTQSGVMIKKILVPKDKAFPLTYQNTAVFVTGEYNEQGVDHVIYMTYIVDKRNRGIQVYMDMTKEIDKNYDKEFMDFIRSIKEI